jgi:hypothetical protein
MKPLGISTWALLNNFVARQMLVGLRELRQLGFVVNVCLRNFESARSTGNVGLDVFHAVNLCQIGSNRAGTAPSEHVGNFE